MEKKLMEMEARLTQVEQALTALDLCIGLLREDVAKMGRAINIVDKFAVEHNKILMEMSSGPVMSAQKMPEA